MRKPSFLYAPAARVNEAPDNARSVRRTATGILCGLLVVFIATSIPDDPPGWVLFIRAMAEAGMIGGLADWFAVEALFRRPLGLPIPHTALLPTNQKRAARNIARFIDEYFMVPGQLVAQIRAVDPLRKVIDWLKQRENARIVGDEISWAVRMLLSAQLDRGVPAPVRQLISDTLRRVAASEQLEDQVAALLKSSLEGEVLDAVLLQVRKAIDENRTEIVRLVQDRSRWWIAKGVDRQMAALLVDGVLSVLDELGDPSSPRRAGFARSVSKIIDRFREDRMISKLIEESLKGREGSDRFMRAVDDLMQAVLAEIDRQATRDPDGFSDAMADAIQDIARYLDENDAAREAMSGRLETALVTVLDALRDPVRDYIAQTIIDWDSDALVTRIELEVGRDLQFIRINGSVLGALLGGFFFLIGRYVL